MIRWFRCAKHQLKPAPNDEMSALLLLRWLTVGVRIVLFKEFQCTSQKSNTRSAGALCAGRCGGGLLAAALIDFLWCPLCWRCLTVLAQHLNQIHTSSQGPSKVHTYLGVSSFQNPRILSISSGAPLQ